MRVSGHIIKIKVVDSEMNSNASFLKFICFNAVLVCIFGMGLEICLGLGISSMINNFLSH